MTFGRLVSTVPTGQSYDLVLDRIQRIIGRKHLHTRVSINISPLLESPATVSCTFQSPPAVVSMREEY